MSSDAPRSRDDARKPRVFKPDDPALLRTDADTHSDDVGTSPNAAKERHVDASSRMRTQDLSGAGFRWGAILLSAAVGALALSIVLWFWRVVGIGLERDDAIGWIVRGLAAVAAIAALAILLKELAGFLRLNRLSRLKADAQKAIELRDSKAEVVVADRLLLLYGQTPERIWAVDRVRQHRSDVLDCGQLLMLVEREVLSGVDQEARRAITESAKRVATVTAMMPMMSLAFLFLIFETLRMLRRVATSYGGRPGFAGSVRLGKTVVGNLIAAGGVALTDDLLGQFVGQDMLRRLSRRLGEGVFNGALVARIGVASLDVIRPLPFGEGRKVRVRDIVTEVFNWRREEKK
jgi:putative membrane protein